MDVNLDSIVSSPLKLAPFIMKKKGFWKRELNCNVNGHKRTLMATLDPVLLPNGLFAGCLFMLVEKQHVINLVNALNVLRAHVSFKNILTKSPALEKTLDICRRAARSTSPILLYGETGTGKELFAQSIHNASERAVNLCAGRRVAPQGKGRFKAIVPRVENEGSPGAYRT